MSVKGMGTRSIAEKDSKSLPLPWWVELLFVQIGLPDSLLRKLLKTKKNCKKLIISNQKRITYALVILFTIGYISPTIKESRYHNNCLNNTVKSLKNNSMKIQSKRIINDLRSYAHRYCNGGDI